MFVCHSTAPVAATVAVVTIEHVEERGQPRLSETISGEPEIPDGGNVREYSPPRRQQSRQTGVSDTAIREIPRSDLHARCGKGDEGHGSTSVRGGELTTRVQGREGEQGQQACVVLQRGGGSGGKLAADITRLQRRVVRAAEQINWTWRVGHEMLRMACEVGRRKVGQSGGRQYLVSVKKTGAQDVPLDAG